MEQYSEATPEVFRLLQNHPNPFNGSTSIRFDLPNRTRVVITIYNIRGQTVATLVDNGLPAGRHVVQWDGRDRSGKSVSTGVYVYRIQTDRYATTRKLLLLQ